MLEEVRKQLQTEVEALNHELSVTLPATLKRAIRNGDLRENGDYHAALERQQFVQARLSHLRARLAKLSQIDLSQIPTGRVGLGSRVTVEDLATGAREDLELVIPDAMDFDRGHISVASPMGRGLVDKKLGDTAVVQLPVGVRKLRILALRTLHEQLRDADGAPGDS
ncbi:MAG TPA: GreA/GreB family elongation factor [Gemmatimonadales bacterium]|nr:GreA/GreB family elongation factor [Gemmatimonadales bacterium]